MGMEDCFENVGYSNYPAALPTKHLTREVREHVGLTQKWGEDKIEDWGKDAFSRIQHLVTGAFKAFALTRNKQSAWMYIEDRMGNVEEWMKTLSTIQDNSSR